MAPTRQTCPGIGSFGWSTGIRTKGNVNAGIAIQVLRCWEDIFSVRVWPADGSKVPRRRPYHLLPLPASSCGLRARVMSIASNQMLLNFGRTKSPGGSSREMGELATVVGRTRCNTSADPICAFLMPAIRLIDTRLASPRGHYVNQFVPRIPTPARLRFRRPDFHEPDCRNR